MNSEYLKKPITAKNINTTVHLSFTLTSCEMQGWRKNMQDAHLHLSIDDHTHLFAVLDGHGGPQVAYYAAKYLPKELMNQPYFKLKNYQRALVNVFARIDELLASHRGEQTLEQYNKELKGTKKIRTEEKANHRAGTTAVVILMTKDKFYSANIGDSRAVLCRGGKAVPLSYDHKPEQPQQSSRIEKAGGTVEKGRINGGLNLSRAFGDFQFKKNQKVPASEQCVISVPDIIETPRSEEDEFILMGCDGVWQRHVSNNQKMIQIVSDLLAKNQPATVLDKLFTQLVAKDQKQKSGFDNMTALLVHFQ